MTRLTNKNSRPVPSLILSQACCRVDLAGGTLDLWPLYLFHPGAVTVNFGVTVMTRCEIHFTRSKSVVLRSKDTGREDRFADAGQLLKAKTFRHPLAGMLCRFFLAERTAPRRGFVLETNSESPAGAGISGSSALMIATTAALARFCGIRLSKEQMRVIAQDVEAQLIGVPAGCQDYYPALYGGVNAVHLTAGGIRREALAVSAREIEPRFVLVYTGAPRQSGTNNWEVFKAHLDGDERVFRNFEEISHIARAMRDALLAHRADWHDVAHLLRDEWKLRKTNAPGITTPLIEALMRRALKQGALAGKVCGAGGGGCIVLLIEPDARPRVIASVEKLGGQVLPFRVAPKGVTVTVT